MRCCGLPRCVDKPPHGLLRRFTPRNDGGGGFGRLGANFILLIFPVSRHLSFGELLLDSWRIFPNEVDADIGIEEVLHDQSRAGSSKFGLPPTKIGEW
jgi:hypothetical protein